METKAADPQQRLKDLRKYAEYKRDFAFFFYKPYEKQKAFHEAGIGFRERAFLAGNQLGKTLAAGAEVAAHATGIYPEGWKGRKFTKPTRGWVSGVTGESTRDNPQRILLGQIGSWGSGMIPRQSIVKTSAARGVPDSVETVIVKHLSGTESQITFKSYADGREKWQGETLDYVWFDEEPPMDIYTEGLTRTNATKGFVFLTLTPLLGMSDVVVRFLQEVSPDRWHIIMNIDDVKHYTEEEKRRIIDAYPPHEREARSKGIPMLGSGRIYPVTEESIKEPPIYVPAWWPQIIAMDFGWSDHPTAAIKACWDRDNDVVHLETEYRGTEPYLAVYAQAIKAMGGGSIPVAWPHDGLIHDKSSGVQIADLYKREGLQMLSEHAQFPDERKNGTEAAIMETLSRMQSGRLKVCENMHKWFEEFRMYHRKDGRVVAEREDLMKATHYLIMMLRYAKAKETPKVKPDRYNKRKSHQRSWMAA